MTRIKTKTKKKRMTKVMKTADMQMKTVDTRKRAVRTAHMRTKTMKAAQIKRKSMRNRTSETGADE